MSATKAKTILKKQTAAGPPVVFTQMEGCTSMTGGPADTTGVNESAKLAGGPTYRSAGKTTFGAISWEGDWCAADPGHASVLAEIQSDTPTNGNWEVAKSLSGATPAAAITGFVSEYGLTIPNTGTVKMRFTLQVTSEATAQASTAVTPNAAYVEEDAEGTEISWNAADIGGVQSAEITGLSRGVVTSHNIKDRTPAVCEPSNSRKRGDFRIVALHDPADTTQVAMDGDKSTATARAIVVTLPSGTTITTEGVVTGREEGEADGSNIVTYSGFLTADLTVA
jgi:hypothetical protein